MDSELQHSISKISASYNPLFKSERYLVHTRESIELELEDAQLEKDVKLIKECTKLLATLDFYLYDDPSWTDVSGERSQSQSEEEKGSGKNSQEVAGAGAGHEEKVITPTAKCDPNLETQTKGKETSQKPPRVKAGFAKPTTLPHRGPSPQGSFRIGQSELTTKQSDSFLDVSGEAKADAIMQEEDRREEDGQGEEEEEEVNEEKSQSQVARDSSTVNSQAVIRVRHCETCKTILEMLS